MAAPAQQLGPYVLERKLGSGAMGEVWLARDQTLERMAAVKLLTSGFASDSERRTRFEREAKAAAKLTHANTVAVYAFGVEGDCAYLAMEYIDGSSLDKLVTAGKPLPWPEATRAVWDAANGLSAAHRIGLIHRDVKPANLIRSREGVTKVADFGLVCTGLGDGHLTRDGAVLGTPAVMAPEQWSSGEVDGRSDLYSLICTYYFLVTGRFPFTAPSVAALGYQHRYEPIPDPRDSVHDLPIGVSRIIARGAAKNAASRYQSADELIAALEKLLAVPHVPLSHRRPSRSVPVAGVVLVILMLTLAAVVYRSVTSNRTIPVAASTPAPASTPTQAVERPITIVEEVQDDTAPSALPGENESSPSPRLFDRSIPAEIQRLKQQHAPNAYALRFDGQLSRVRIPASAFTYRGRSSLTLEAIVTPEVVALTGQAVIGNTTGGDGFILRLLADRWRFGYFHATRSMLEVSSQTPVREGDKVHLAGVIDKDAEEIRFFVNGVLASTPVRISQRYRVSPWDTIIGADPNHPQPRTFNQLFRGLIEQVHISTSAQYPGNFAAPPILTAEPNTVVLYHFNEGEGFTAFDSSGKGNHGSIEGAQWVSLSTNTDSGK